MGRLSLAVTKLLEDIHHVFDLIGRAKRRRYQYPFPDFVCVLRQQEKVELLLLFLRAFDKEELDFPLVEASWQESRHRVDQWSTVKGVRVEHVLRPWDVLRGFFGEGGGSVLHTTVKLVARF